jgi:hypothetical protein
MGLRMVLHLLEVVVEWWWWIALGMPWAEAGDWWWCCPLLETKVVFVFCFVYLFIYFEGWRCDEWGGWRDKVEGFSAFCPCDLLICSFNWMTFSVPLVWLLLCHFCNFILTTRIS